VPSSLAWCDGGGRVVLALDEDDHVRLLRVNIVAIAVSGRVRGHDRPMVVAVVVDIAESSR